MLKHHEKLKQLWDKVPKVTMYGEVIGLVEGKQADEFKEEFGKIILEAHETK